MTVVSPLFCLLGWSCVLVRSQESALGASLKDTERAELADLEAEGEMCVARFVLDCHKQHAAFPARPLVLVLAFQVH